MTWFCRMNANFRGTSSWCRGSGSRAESKKPRCIKDVCCETWLRKFSGIANSRVSGPCRLRMGAQTAPVHLRHRPTLGHFQRPSRSRPGGREGGSVWRRVVIVLALVAVFFSACRVYCQTADSPPPAQPGRSDQAHPERLGTIVFMTDFGTNN